MLFGGLGNQMSQYAFYLRKKHNDPSTRVIYNRLTQNDHFGYELSRVFGIKLDNSVFSLILFYLYRLSTPKKRWQKPLSWLLKQIGIKVIKEAQNYDYNEDNYAKRRGINFYWGGWHSEKNFLPVASSIREVFHFGFAKNNEGPIATVVDAIRNTNSISIHVRRGDYLKPTTGIHQFADIATISYYSSAINYIRSRIESASFFVFSDDLNWCRGNLGLDSATYVDCNQGTESWKDMMLISLCKHNINANSSFSWWGAWLNSNGQKIITVPDRFIQKMTTKDVYPEPWIKLKSQN